MASVLSGEWKKDAACKKPGASELFFPGKGEVGSQRFKQAVAICEGCGVRKECLEYALMFEGLQGIWGGTSNKERQRMRRRLKLV